MKNQYFGDINDYRKYGLLRILSNNGQISTAICWMLTADDGRTDGKFIDYLWKPNNWRALDPALFDSLAACLANTDDRNVRCAETTGILPRATFYSKLLNDNAAERQVYFQEFFTLAQGIDLIFFDPDNGLEVKTRPYGRKDSCKFLYWSELLESFNTGHSICVYQHFPRIKRDIFIADLAQQIYTRLGVTQIITLRTARVLFLLVPQADKLAYFELRSREIEKVWGSEISVQKVVAR